jgi:hypothetical protein
MRAAGCKREGEEILHNMPEPLTGLYQPYLCTDYQSVFGKKLDFQAFGCSKLSAFLLAECSDFLESPGETIQQYIVEVCALELAMHHLRSLPLVACSAPCFPGAYLFRSNSQRAPQF